MLIWLGEGNSIECHGATDHRRMKGPCMTLDVVQYWWRAVASTLLTTPSKKLNLQIEQAEHFSKMMLYKTIYLVLSPQHRVYNKYVNHVLMHEDVRPPYMCNPTCLSVGRIQHDAVQLDVVQNLQVINGQCLNQIQCQTANIRRRVDLYVDEHGYHPCQLTPKLYNVFQISHCSKVNFQHDAMVQYVHDLIHIEIQDYFIHSYTVLLYTR